MKKLFIGLILLAGAGHVHADNLSINAGRCVAFLSMGKQITKNDPNVQIKISQMTDTVSNLIDEKRDVLSAEEFHTASEEYSLTLLTLVMENGGNGNEYRQQFTDQTQQGIEEWVEQGAAACEQFINLKG